MPGMGQPGCTIYWSPSDILGRWPHLEYLPRPEPPREYAKAHGQWKKEYSQWRSLKCSRQKGAYFCRRHGKWITCVELKAGVARPQNEERDAGYECPASHYEWEDIEKRFIEAQSAELDSLDRQGSDAGTRDLNPINPSAEQVLESGFSQLAIGSTGYGDAHDTQETNVHHNQRPLYTGTSDFYGPSGYSGATHYYEPNTNRDYSYGTTSYQKSTADARYSDDTLPYQDSMADPHYLDNATQYADSKTRPGYPYDSTPHQMSSSNRAYSDDTTTITQHQKPTTSTTYLDDRSPSQQPATNASYSDDPPRHQALVTRPAYVDSTAQKQKSTTYSGYQDHKTHHRERPKKDSRHSGSRQSDKDSGSRGAKTFKLKESRLKSVSYMNTPSDPKSEPVHIEASEHNERNLQIRVGSQDTGHDAFTGNTGREEGE